MALSITPAVCRDRGEWVSAIGLFALGVAIADIGVAVAVLAVFGGLSIAVSGAIYAIFALAITSAASLRDFGMKVPLPYRRGQVPEIYRDTLGIRSLSFIFGLELGAGFPTHFTTSFHVLMLALVPLTPSVSVLLLSACAFAAGRLVIVLTTASARELDDVPVCLPNGLHRMRAMHIAAGTSATVIAVSTLIGGAPNW